MLTVVTTIDATIETFNETSFRESLARLVDGVSPDDISLEVTAASLIVEATVRTTERSSAEGLQTMLTTMPLGNLSAALGVPVQGMQPMTLVSMDVHAPSMPPLVPWVPEEWVMLERVAATAAAALLVALPSVLCLYLMCMMRSPRRRKASARPSRMAECCRLILWRRRHRPSGGHSGDAQAAAPTEGGTDGRGDEEPAELPQRWAKTPDLLGGFRDARDATLHAEITRNAAEIKRQMARQMVRQASAVEEGGDSPERRALDVRVHDLLARAARDEERSRARSAAEGASCDSDDGGGDASRVEIVIAHKGGGDVDRGPSTMMSDNAGARRNEIKIAEVRRTSRDAATAIAATSGGASSQPNPLLEPSLPPPESTVGRTKMRVRVRRRPRRGEADESATRRPPAAPSQGLSAEALEAILIDAYRDLPVKSAPPPRPPRAATRAHAAGAGGGLWDKEQGHGTSPPPPPQPPPLRPPLLLQPCGSTLPQLGAAPGGGLGPSTETARGDAYDEHGGGRQRRPEYPAPEQQPRGRAAQHQFATLPSTAAAAVIAHQRRMQGGTVGGCGGGVGGAGAAAIAPTAVESSAAPPPPQPVHGEAVGAAANVGDDDPRRRHPRPHRRARADAGASKARGNVRQIV